MLARRTLGGIAVGVVSLCLVALGVVTLARPGGRRLVHVAATSPSTAASTSTPTTSISGAQSLQSVIAPILPSGAQLTDAEDHAGDPPASIDMYSLPNGQMLRATRQKFSLPLPASMDPQRLIVDPSVDSVTQLSSGSRLVKIGHNTSVQQVLLGRPDGTVINIILLTPKQQSSAPGFTPAYSLDSLASAVQQKLDNASSDVS